MERALCDFWIPLETWSDEQFKKAREALEDHYSFLLPHKPFAAMILPMHMSDVARRAKKSATGLDGWTHEELAALPMQAWYWFLIVCSVAPMTILTSLTAVFKRVPISKTGSSVCLPHEVRPIDVFSVILRIHATAATRQLLPWTREVLHPGQYASRGGILVALSGIAFATELSLIGAKNLFGIAVDFEKMFNMLSGLVASEVAAFMGLSFPSIMDLLAPVACAIGTWKLPLSAAPTPFATPRGLPQGMATSVLLAELAITPLLWRITRSLPDVIVCAYVDDLNMHTGNKEHLVRVVALLRDFENHFSLSLAQAKTKVWATDVKTHEELANGTGFPVERSICALGGEWPTNPAAKLSHTKELARLDQCMERLARARTLPMPAPKLALIVSTGCLSLLDFLNLPNPRPYMKLRAMLKDVFDLRAGAPEVVTCLLQKGSLDPHVRWLLAILRLWHHVLQGGLISKMLKKS